MADNINLAIDLVGIVLGVAFVYLQSRTLHTLVGSVFKRYYN
jgi:hypothetical protein